MFIKQSIGDKYKFSVNILHILGGNKMRKIPAMMATIALLLSLTMSNAYALHHKMKEGGDYNKCPLFSKEVQEKLNLTEEQKQVWAQTKDEIKGLRMQYKDKFKADMEAVKTAHQDLMDQIDTQSQAAQPDIQAIITAKQKLFDTVKTLKTDKKDLYEKTMPLKVAFFNQLNPDQQRMVLTNLKGHMEKMKDRMKDRFEKMKDMMENNNDLD